MPLHKGRGKPRARSAQVRKGAGAKEAPITADGRAPVGKEFPEQERDLTARNIKLRK